MNLLRYVKKAFLYHWNLLAFGGAVAFSFLSGRPDVALPLVAAAELAYLGLLGTHPRFKKYVDAHEAKHAREQAQGEAGRALDRILTSLPPRSLARYEALRQRCTDLRNIATNLHGQQQDAAPTPLDDLQLSSLDHLLWTFLRLLYTQQMLARFHEQTNEEQIRRTMSNLDQSLKSQLFPPEDPQKQKIRQTLEDNIATCRQRLANLQKARDNSELVRLEIDRLENKIHSLCEMSVNRKEAAELVGQVDQVAASMVETERTMSELQFATGLLDEEEVPRLMQRETAS